MSVRLTFMYKDKDLSAVPACILSCVHACVSTSLPPLSPTAAVDLDEAVIRRMPRRIFVPLPDAANRQRILQVVGAPTRRVAAAMPAAVGRGASAWRLAWRPKYRLEPCLPFPALPSLLCFVLPPPPHPIHFTNFHPHTRTCTHTATGDSQG